MAKFALVHGAWHNKRCWEGVIEQLRKKGHEAEAVTLAGNGPDEDRRGITYKDIVRSLVEFIGRQETPVVLVGHSSAGHVIQVAVPKVPDRIEKIVFNNAWVLPHGKSQFDLIPDRQAVDGMRKGAAASGCNAIPLIDGFIRSALAYGVPKEKQDELIAILVPQPVALFETAADTEAFAGLPIPKVLLYCKDDVSLPPGVYLGMYRTLGDNPVVEIDGNHETLYFQPDRFSRGLIDCLNA